jgi:penicillin G amidase
LLDYQPEAWRPSDSLAIEGEFRWYLTVRFPVIAIPELAKRALGDGPLYHAFLLGEVDDESVVWSGEFTPRPRKQGDVGTTQGDAGPGSNNWVLSGARTTTGAPIVASDPHIPFQAVSMWHEVHLSGGAFHVAGVCLAGLPGVMIGRNRKVAWGITNNICSLRDLYEEKTDPAHPGCYLYDGAWEKARTREETIQVRDAAPVRRTVVASRNGPIVDDLLPLPARATGPVSLRWLGFEPCGWMTALIQSNRAKTCNEFREALSPWQAPTFNLVFADADGHIGFQSVGRIPIRNKPERGYRPGWDPAHQWDGVIPFEGMPRLADPERGFVVTANNRVAPDDFPYPLAGAWSSGHRARRIRQSLQVNPKMSAKDCTLLQQDIHSGRAALGVPRLLNLIGDAEDEPTSQALGYLRDWDHSMDTESVAAAIFHVFFSHWCRVVASERFPAEQSAFVAANAGGLAIELLADDALGWFVLQDRVRAARRALVNALGELGEKLGPDMAQWTWGRLHTLNQKHYLSGRGDLGLLLDLSGLEMRGDGVTVCSSTPDASHQAWLGAGYRMVADLADPKQTLLAMEIAGASGHPGSPHYNDQIAPWERFEYHAISLAADKPSGGNVLVLVGK